MATNYVKARQKQRIATAEEWQSANPVLLNGELAIESDSRRLKVGNGNTAYSALPFLGGSEPIAKELTLYASDWSNAQYVIDDDDISATSIILFDAPVGATLLQYTTLQSAVIVAASQTDGQLVLKALGVVPAIDVSVSLAII